MGNKKRYANKPAASPGHTGEGAAGWSSVACLASICHRNFELIFCRTKYFVNWHVDDPAGEQSAGLTG